MASTLTLNEDKAVFLDGSGNGTVQLFPDGSHEKWMPTGASVKCSSSVLEASCKIYIGNQVNDHNFVDGTLSGSTGDSTDRVSGYVIGRTSDPYIFAVWSGGDVGAQATLSITGTKTIP